MKKLLFALLALMVFGACHRPRVRHDHSKQMQAVRLPVDSDQRNDIAADVENWEDEDENVSDKKRKRKKAPANVDEQIERMMMGEDDDFGELPE
jgi:hypothetical protein